MENMRESETIGHTWDTLGRGDNQTQLEDKTRQEMGSNSKTELQIKTGKNE